MGNFTDYNKTEAFRSLNNMNENLSWKFNESNYTAIQQMTNANAADSPATAAQSIFTPINSFWASSAVYGSWFYVLLIFLTVGTVYIKSQNLFRTCITMLFMGLIASAPGATGVIYIPSQALHTLYILTAVGLVGVLYTFWVGD